MTKQPSLIDPADDLAQVLGPDLAKHFLDHRKALKKPMTAYAAQLMAKKLRTFPDPVAAVEQSILKGWQDVFAVETERAFGRPQQETVLQRRERELAERIRREHGIGREGNGDNQIAQGVVLRLADHR